MNHAYIGAGAPLLSIVIPTRERCEFLVACVQSALACRDPDIEVIVSDNASTDGTRTAIGAMTDPRLRYENTGSRIPMHDNFEFALGKASGRYLMFIGDDDGVLPERLAHLLALLRADGPEVVNWQVPNYVWPGAANGPDGLLTLKPMHLAGGRTRHNAGDLLRGLGDGSKASYRIGGAKIYHGCVARTVVEKVKARAGRYFFVPWPDVGAAVANLFVTDTICMLGSPCTLGGESRASNGWSQRFQETSIKVVDTPHAAFVKENLDRPDTAAADARVRPISALTFFTLAESIRRMDTARELTLNRSAWTELIESEVASVAEPARSEQADIIDANLKALGLPNLDRSWDRKNRHKPARVRPPARRQRLLPNRMNIVSRPGLCTNVFEAALTADRILAGPDGPAPRRGLALAAAWFAALARAAAIIRDPKRATPASAAVD